ncbi:hypothetical protein ABPG72_019097 [Tetrahymena utriculariae]
MNLSATKQQPADSNRQNAMTGDQDISIFCLEESTIEQSLRCSLQVSQSNFKQQGSIKQNMNKLLFHNKQFHRTDNTKTDFKINQASIHNANNLKKSGIYQTSLDYKNKFTIFENKGEVNPSDHSIVIQKNKDLLEEENLIKLVSEHLIQSIQYLQKRQNQQQSAHLETEGEDVPDENIAIHTIKSDIVGPNLLSQKNETTDMEKVKYLEQNFTQLAWLQECKKKHINDRNNQNSQQQQYSLDNSDSDTDLETPQILQQIVQKKGSSSETPILARNNGKRKQSNLEESKTTSQIINSFSEDCSSDSLEENDNSQEMNLQIQQSEGSNQKQKSRQVKSRQEEQLQKDIKTMKLHMHANGLINSIDLQKDQNKSQRLAESQQFNRSPKKFLTTSNVQINTNQQDSDSNYSQNIARCVKKQYTAIKPVSAQNKLGINLENNNQIKQSQEFSPPFDLMQHVERNSFLGPPQMNDNHILSGSTMDETYDLQQHIQQMKQLSPFEDKQMNQKFSNLMQNSMIINQKKKSILSTQTHNHSNFSGKKNDQQNYGVRFDQNVQFFDSNLDLLKKHHDQSMNQSLVPESKGGSQLAHHPGIRLQSQNGKAQQNFHNVQLTPSIIEQRSSEIKNQHIIQEGWLLKKSTNKMLNTYQKRYFILTSEKLFYSRDPTFKKIKGCINIKYLTCFVSLDKTNSKKIHLKITEMKKLLKLKEIVPGDISRWQKNLQQVISYYYNQEKVMMAQQLQIKNNYKRDVITESDLETIAETGDLIIFQSDSEKSKNISIYNHFEMGMLIKFNSNDLRVFYVDKNNSINLCHWERFILENDIYNSLIFRKLQMSERNQILPYIYESVRQHLNDNYKKKLKDTLSDSQENSKLLPSIQRNSQLIASIYQKANLIKQQQNINKYTTDSFSQKKRLKLLNNAKLSNEITVVLKRHIFFASDNSDLQ